LRYSNVFGPRQDPHGEAGVVAIFSGNLAEGRTSTINGTGEQTRDYVYVEDVARANVLALEGEVPPGAYNVGTGS
jgi:UDP-glucose 4-epimerase